MNGSDNPMARRWISPAVRLVQADGRDTCACAACGHVLGPADTPWKHGARRRETPLARAGGPAWDTGDAAVVLREFFCPGCAVLLDTETAMAEDPVLVDRLAGA